MNGTYSTMEAKVEAYKNFFLCEARTLIVVGEGGSGKSAALEKVKTRDECVVYAEGTPVIMPAKGDDVNIYGIRRTIFHLYPTEMELANALKKKYCGNIIYFERVSY